MFFHTNFRPCFLALLLAFALSMGKAGADPVTAFFAARSAASELLLTGAAGADAICHPGSYGGRTVDVAVTVSGLVTAGEDRTALLSVGDQSLSVPLPLALRGVAWLD